MLSREEIMRYSRQLSLPGFGRSAQEKLKTARVLVVGAGGLGCPALTCLTSAGVGAIAVADGDRVELSNLQRQWLFSDRDIGVNKAEAAAARLRVMNPHVCVTAHPIDIDETNAAGISRGFDVLIDCTDNLPSKYLLDKTCKLTGIPWITGSVYRYEGQVAVLNFPLSDTRRSPGYRDIFPGPGEESPASCAAAGIAPQVAGIVGLHLANEAIKLITGIGSLLSGEILHLNLLTLELSRFSVQGRSGLPAGRTLTATL